MDSLVIYATRTGNTRTIAEAIADALRSEGHAQVRSVEEAVNGLPAGIDLLVVGGPTEGHGMTEPMVAFLDRLEERLLGGIAVAAFDTRLWWPKSLSGSAAEGIAKRLREVGATVIVPPESFIVTMKPELKPGEAERARLWAASLIAAVKSAMRVPVA